MGSPRVLVATGSNWISLARLPHVLHQAGCTVEALCPADWALAQTRFIEVRHDAPATLPEYLAALRAHLAQHAYDWVILGDDPLCTAVAERRSEAWAQALLPTRALHDVADLLVSKTAFSMRAQVRGIPVPASRVCASAADVEAAAQTLGFPLMMKQPRSFGGLGVCRVTDREGARQAFAERSQGEPLLAQRFVEGRLGNTLVLFVQGTPIQWLSAFKVRTWPGPFGPSTARQVTAPAQIPDVLRKVGEMTQLHGFAAVDWVLQPSGELAVLELNARPAPTLHMGTRLGTDFSLGIRQFLRGDSRPLAAGPVPGPAAVESMFPEDLFRAQAEGDAAFLARWTQESALRRDVPWEDPGLMTYYRQRRKIRALLDALRPHRVPVGEATASAGP